MSTTFHRRIVQQRRSSRRQRGTVAIMVGVAIFALIGLLGIVIDLGHLYVRKTELQNAADAAALAAVKQIDGKATGIDAAVAAAIAIAGFNASDFARTAVTIAAAQVSFGSSPDGPWVDAATAKGDPSLLSFVKVDTDGIAQGTRATWFMPLLNSALASTTANGVAVAGSTLCDAVPIFICPPVGGFTPGQSYFFADQPGAPIGPGNIGYFDPVPPDSKDTLIPPGASEMSDVVCVGKTSCIGAGTYSSRTQAAFGKMAQAFNTRFGEFKGAFKDSAEVCRPDINIQGFSYAPCAPGDNCVMVDWMVSAAVSQSGAPGVHWSALRPATLPGVPPVNGSYPSAASGGGTPYTQTTGKYHLPPTGYESSEQAGRRIITMAVGGASACDGSVNGSGKAVPVTGFGRFFMQVKAEGTKNPKGIYVEYIETLARTPVSAPDIKLYR